MPTGLGYAEYVPDDLYSLQLCVDDDEWPLRTIEIDSMALENVGVNGVPDLCWKAKER